jgi:hypothetical protein
MALAEDDADPEVLLETVLDAQARDEARPA